MKRIYSASLLSTDGMRRLSGSVDPLIPENNSRFLVEENKEQYTKFQNWLLITLHYLGSIDESALIPCVYMLQKQQKVLPTKYAFKLHGRKIVSNDLNHDLKKLKENNLYTVSENRVGVRKYRNIKITSDGWQVLNPLLRTSDKLDGNALYNLRLGVNKNREVIIKRGGIKELAEKVRENLKINISEFQHTLFIPEFENPKNTLDVYLSNTKARSDAWDKFIKARDMKPADRWNSDQFAASEESVTLELEYMMPWIKDATLIFLGGNDGMPIWMNHLLGYGLLDKPKKVIILEKDKQIVSWLKSHTANLNIEFHNLDLSDSLPQELLSLENVVVFADPPFNCAGMNVWCTRASQLCTKGSHFYLCVPAGVPFTTSLDPFVINQCIAYGFGIKGKMQQPIRYEKYGGIPSNLWHLEKETDYTPRNSCFEFDIYHSCRSGNEFCKRIRSSQEYEECKKAREETRQKMMPAAGQIVHRQ